jgi:hypothetical protein
MGTCFISFKFGSSMTAAGIFPGSSRTHEQTFMVRRKALSDSSAPKRAQSLASDPCVYLNNSATAQEGLPDYNSSPKECKDTGGTWIPQGDSWKIDPASGTVIDLTSFSTLLGCIGDTVWDDTRTGAVNGAIVGGVYYGATGLVLSGGDPIGLGGGLLGGGHIDLWPPSAWG